MHPTDSSPKTVIPLLYVQIVSFLLSSGTTRECVAMISQLGLLTSFFSSFRPYSPFRLIIPELNLSHVRPRCEVGPHGGQRMRRRCEETMMRGHQQRRALVPKRAQNPRCAASHTMRLAVRDYRLELPMICGRLPVALKSHPSSRPWFTEACGETVVLKQLAFSSWKANPTEGNLSSFHKARNKSVSSSFKH